MNRFTIESLKHGARFLAVPEDDLGIPREELASTLADGVPAPSDAEVRQFAETVSKMHAGDSGILPSWIVGELTGRWDSGRQILMYKSADENIKIEKTVWDKW